MSWGTAPTTNVEEMTRKVRGILTELMENDQAISVMDLGDFNDDVIYYRIDELVEFGFKILRNAKAAQLLGSKAKVDKTHIAIAFSKLTKPTNLTDY